MTVGTAWAASTQGPFSLHAELHSRDGPLFQVVLPNASSKATSLAVLRGAYAAINELSQIFLTTLNTSRLEDDPLPPLVELLRHVSITLTVSLQGVVPQGASIGLASSLSVLSLLFKTPLFNKAVTGIVSLSFMILIGMMALYTTHMSHLPPPPLLSKAVPC